MKLSCPACQTKYRVADEKVPARGARAHCPHCGQLILIPGSEGRGDTSGIPPGGSGVDYGQTMAYDFSEVDQSITEVTDFLERLSVQEPYFGEGVSIVLRDQVTGEEYPLRKPDVTIGRSGADINLSDPEVSRRHCRIRVLGDRLVLHDLESTNGTFVGDRKIVTAYRDNGQPFRVGNTILFPVISQR